MPSKMPSMLPSNHNRLYVRMSAEAKQAVLAQVLHHLAARLTWVDAELTKLGVNSVKLFDQSVAEVTAPSSTRLH